MQQVTDPTKSVICEMMRENTGTHFLDSGGTSGRSWQRNQGVTDEVFEASAPATLSFRYDEPDVTLNTYHFLAAHLDHDPAAEKLLRIFEAAADSTCSIEATRGLLEWLEERGCELGGIYGEGEPVVNNTYNGADLLSQTIQYTYATVEGTVSMADIEAMVLDKVGPDDAAMDLVAELWADNPDGGELYFSNTYVFLQVHGGADVRGGYTDVRVFTENGRTELGILDNARATIYDDSVDGFHSRREALKHGNTLPPAYWTTDDGYHWYAEGCSGVGAEPALNEFEVRELPEKYDAEDAMSRVDEDAYRVGNQLGHTGAIKYAKEFLDLAKYAENPKSETKWRLIHAALTKEPLDFLPRTSDGVGFSPYTRGVLKASIH